MIRSTFLVRIAVLAVVISSAFVRPSYAEEGAVVIKISDTEPYFSPAKATVRVGEPVQWVNESQSVYSVTNDASLVQERKSASKTKSSARVFDSGFLPPGASYTFKFTAPGTYRYYGVPFEKPGMVGVITVRR
ncbi:MAG TPA: plastocyanin/azurin family copper-binding protein [Candidatus Binataceae bacterium]|nr:plastocyanin/azurin family copper-binding protein [Candidatus Binataceae bacterium]